LISKTKAEIINNFNYGTLMTFDNNYNLYYVKSGVSICKMVGTEPPNIGLNDFVGSTTGATGFADGTGALALFSNITGMAFDSNNILYVADAGNQHIRLVTPEGVVQTIRQTGLLASLGSLIVDNSKNIYYATGVQNNILPDQPVYNPSVFTYITSSQYNKLTITSSYNLPFMNPLTNNVGYVNSPSTSTTNGAEIFDFSLPSEPVYTIENITNTTFCRGASSPWPLGAQMSFQGKPFAFAKLLVLIFPTP
jgi:hypothetical protein